MKPVFGCLLLAVVIGHISAIPFDDRLFGAQLKDGETGAVPVMTKFRLPTDLKPTGYEVHVDPDLAKAEFAGTVKITLTASHSTNFITLNAKYIKLPSAVPVAVTRINTNRPTSTIPVKSSVLDEANEQLIIELDRALSPKSTYVVQIAYTGRLGSDMSGFYLSRYTNSSGAEKLLASTQFEPTGARRAFPCFDEPNYKTPFVIKINRHRHQKAISNMPVSTSVEIANSDKVTDTFQQSPPMPTYLVGFAVFEFNSLSDKDGKFRVWGREDVVKTQGQYIFDKGPKILAALSDYMGFDYYKMLPKMDLVAVPDFDAGAMENWGMNTYREACLFSIPSEVKAAQTLNIVGTVAHEFSHQWFGDLLTPYKWDYTWLKESFATFFGCFYSMDVVEPTWRMEDLFVVEQVQVAFNSDLKGSHAMTSETTTPDSISETFDHIIYNKGGSVLRMIENVLTPTVFQNALQDYLRNGADLGGTVEPANLWDAFDEVLTEIGGAQYLPPNSTSITGFVDQWVNKPGFPLVTFSRNYSSKVVTVTQQRFLVEKADRDADKTNWTIPLTYTTKTNANFSSRANLFWFDRFKPSVQFSIPENNDWLIANLKEVGFYRVNYDAQNWALIAAQLSANPAQIHLLNRAQILDDAFTLARADLVPYEAALELTRYLKTEKDFIPWYAVWSHIRDLLHTYAQTEVANQMKTYFIDRLEGIFNELGLEDKSTEENMSKLGRSSISLWICNLGHSGCYNQAVAEFRTWIRAPEKSNIPPNIKDAVYCMGIKYGSGEEWTRLWQYYLTTDLASEKIAVMYALGCSQNETVLYDYLSKITDPKSGIRSQDHYIVIRGVLGERPGLRAGLKFLKDKTHSLLEEVKKDELSNAGENLKSIISTVGAGISSKDELNQFTSILTGYQSNPTIGASINKTLTHIQERFTRSANHQKALEKWFGANTPSTTPSPTTPSQSPLPTHPTSHPTHATTQKPSGATGLRQFAPSVMVATALVVLVRFGQS